MSQPSRPWTDALRSRHMRVIAVATAALLAYITRRPDLWAIPQLWAEDGTVFFFDAVTKGWESWPVPYAGYLNFTSRTIACLTVRLPWEIIPSVYVWCAGLLAALVVTRVSFARLPIWPRVVGAVAMVGVPHGGEVFLNMTNLNWILGILLGVNLLEPGPASRSESLRRGCEVFMAGLSGAVILLLFPFAMLWAWHTRHDRRSWIVIAAWCITFLLQLVVLLESSRSASVGIGEMIGALHWVLPRYASDLFLGRWLSFNPALGLVICLVVGVAMVGLLLDRTNRFRLRAGLIFCAAAVFLAAGRAAIASWPNPFGGGARYTYLPFFFVIWGMAWLAAGTSRSAWRVCASLLFILPLISAAPMWVARPVTQYDWLRQVREVRAGSRTRFEIPPNISFAVPRPSEFQK